MSMTFKKKQILVADIPTETGRIYPHEVLLGVVESLKEKELFGSFVNVNFINDDGVVDMTKAAIICSNFELVGNSLVCDFKILDTVYGVILRQLINEFPFALTPSGFGKVDENLNIYDYSLTSVDIKMV